VHDAGLGRAAEFTPEAIAEQMRALLAEGADGTSDRLRSGRARWARENVSLDAVADRVAATVSAAIPAAAATLDHASDIGRGTSERPRQ
jgi:hypothetical protein